MTQTLMCVCVYHKQIQLDPNPPLSVRSAVACSDKCLDRSNATNASFIILTLKLISLRLRADAAHCI